MDIEIQIDDPFAPQIKAELIEAALTRTLTIMEMPSAVTVVITDSQAVQELNAQYRGVDSPTDVLSFGNEPDPDFPDPEEDDYLGDVIIAYPVAEAQAQAAGHAVMDEVILLAVHGTLHLLGFDHDTPEDKAEMWAKQQQIMAELGLAHIQPTEN